jgi:hypothetical protein
MAYSPNPPPYDRGSGPAYPPYDRGTGPAYQPYDRGTGPAYQYDRGYGPVPREHPDGTTILVLGILGLVLCSICAPFAWAKGNKALNEIDRYPEGYTNRATVQAGRICGIVGTCIAIGLIILYVLIAIAAAGAST